MRVSIIVPVYKDPLVYRCIDSVRNQTYKDIELIVIDDPDRKGVSWARNEGIKKAKGEVIMFVDSDDYIPDTAIDTLVNAYKKNKCDMTIGDFIKVKDGVTLPQNWIRFMGDTKLNVFGIERLMKCYLSRPNKWLVVAFCWGRLFRRKIIKDFNIMFNEELHTSEDIDFNARYLYHSHSLQYVNRPVYLHTINDTPKSATFDVSSGLYRLFGFREALWSVANVAKDRRLLGNAFISFTIIQLIRICGQGAGSRKFIKAVINHPTVKDNLQYYNPNEGDSRLIPFLMRLGIPSLIMWVCKWKAKKRYNWRKV